VAEEERGRAEGRLYVADMNLASQAITQGNIARARELLAAHRNHKPDLRGFDWRYLWTKSRGQHVRELTGHTGPLSDLAWSPDNRLLASRSFDGVLKVWDVRTGKELATIEDVKALGSFTPDGRRVLVSKEDGIYTFDFATRQSIAFAKDGGLVIGLLADGQTVTSTHKDFALKLWDLSTGREKFELPGRGGLYHREMDQSVATAGAPAHSSRTSNFGTFSDGSCAQGFPRIARCAGSDSLTTAICSRRAGRAES
jgi:WD40 repeat protein